MDINPLKQARLDRHLTQKQLARLAGISQNAVVKYEHGLYRVPSSNIIKALWNKLPQTLRYPGYETFNSGICITYTRWRYEMIKGARNRLSVARYYGNMPRPVGLHPFADWRINYLGIESQMELCKLLVLHPSIVSQYESGRTHSMPSEIKSTLTLAGLPEITIDALDIEGRLFND